MAERNEKDQKEQIIELSDIAVGTSMEDEAIIELTEEVVDEARNGISGATGSAAEDSQELELHREADFEEQQPEAALASEGIDVPAEPAMAPEAPENRFSSEAEDIDEIARELDDYFPLDGEPAPEAGEERESQPAPAAGQGAAFTEEQLEAALERVIEKKYAAVIERLINEGIKQRVTEDIEKIKEFILNRNAGP